MRCFAGSDTRPKTLRVPGEPPTRPTLRRCPGTGRIQRRQTEPFPTCLGLVELQYVDSLGEFPAFQGQQRSFVRIFHTLSWAFARSPSRVSQPRPVRRDNVINHPWSFLAYDQVGKGSLPCTETTWTRTLVCMRSP
jgi:hypothetical protein